MDDFADRPNRLKSRNRSIHCQALIATLILAGGITTACLLFFSTDLPIGIGGFVGICCGTYALYLTVGCCCNRLLEYLKNIDRG